MNFFFFFPQLVCSLQIRLRSCVEHICARELCFQTGQMSVNATRLENQNETVGNIDNGSCCRVKIHAERTQPSREQESASTQLGSTTDAAEQSLGTAGQQCFLRPKPFTESVATSAGERTSQSALELFQSPTPRPTESLVKTPSR